MGYCTGEVCFCPYPVLSKITLIKRYPNKTRLAENVKLSLNYTGDKPERTR